MSRLWTIAKLLLCALLLGAFLAARGAAPHLPGTVFVLSAPSGTGKSTLARLLLRRVPDLAFAVSHTTRPPRPGEVDGRDYRFVTAAAFDQLLTQNDFVEWVELYGHRYGLSRASLEQPLASGKDLLMDLDTQGARAVRRAIPGAVTLFLLPPSAAELARRLRARGSEPEAQVQARLAQAKAELARFGEYDYLVVNDTMDQALRELEAVILAARARLERRRDTAQRILDGFR